MYKSPLFTTFASLTLCLLIAVIVMQMMEMQVYEMLFFVK